MDLLIPDNVRGVIKSKNFDIVSTNFFSNKFNTSLKFLSDNDLCKLSYLHDRILGLKILRPSLVIERKKIDQRTKDINDIKVFLKMKKSKYPQFRFLMLKSKIIHLLLKNFL